MDRAFFAIVAFCSMAACNPTTGALVIGNPDMALRIASGEGAVLRDQSGATSFRYVFIQGHLDGLVEPQGQEDVRVQYISQFIAEKGICPRGWKIDRRTIVSGHFYYDGSCNA